MNLEKSTALALRIGIVLGVILLVIGLSISMTGGDENILHIGILILILSPLLGIITSFVSLLLGKDYYWAAMAGILIVITLIGMNIHI